MSGGAGIRLVAAALLVGLLAACGATTVVVQRPPIPDQPDNPDRLGEAVVVGEGNDAALGGYRAWVYRTRDGMTCFEMSTAGMSTMGCSPAAEGPIGIGTHETDGGWFVAGGTTKPAVRAVVQLADGSEVAGPVVPAPPGLADGAAYLVIPVSGAVPQSVELLGGDGTVLDTIGLTP